MSVLAVRTLRDRWALLVGTFVAIAIGVGIVQAGLMIAVTVAGAVPPAMLSQADVAAYRTRLDGTNTINGIASVLACFLTIFVVRSTVDFAVSERRRDLAVLRLVGLTRGQLGRLLLLEAAVVGLAGSLAGAVLGLAFGVLQQALFVAMGILPPDVGVHWRPALLGFDLALGVGVAVVGAWASSRRAMRVPALEALHQRGVAEHLMTRGRWVWCVLMALLTLAQVIAAVAVGGFLGPLLLGLGIIMTGSVAMSGFSPLLVPAAGLLLRRCVRGPLAELAIVNLRDGAKRAASVAAPLIVLIGLVVGLQGLLDTQTEAGTAEATRFTRADFNVQTTGDPTARIAQIPGVATADAETEIPAALTLVRNGLPTDLPVSIFAVEPHRFAATHPLPIAQGDPRDFPDSGIIFGPGTENGQLAKPIDRIELDLQGQQYSLREVARTGEGLANTQGAFISRALVPTQVLATSATTTHVTLTPDADPAAVRRHLTELNLGQVTDQTAEATHQNSTKQDENRAVMAALVGVGSIYALINLLSTLAIATQQRRTELAVARLAGLTRRQVAHTVLLETAATLAIALVLGLVVSITALVGLWVTTTRTLGAPIIAIPWGLLAAMTTIVTVLAAATATLAVRGSTDRTLIHELTTHD